MRSTTTLIMTMKNTIIPSITTRTMTTPSGTKMSMTTPSTTTKIMTTPSGTMMSMTTPSTTTKTTTTQSGKTMMSTTTLMKNMKKNHGTTTSLPMKLMIMLSSGMRVPIWILFGSGMFQDQPVL
jgi:glucoamylase